VADDMSASLPTLQPTLEVEREIERFLYHEAELLDERRWREWLDLFGPDARYRMPVRTNLFRRDAAKADTRDGCLVIFDDNRATLEARVAQLEMDSHWAEEPPSRTRHMVTNVRVTEIESSDSLPRYLVRSAFLCYRNRLETEVNLLVGERTDILRRDDRLQIVERTILLDQSTFLAKNLTIFL
jgi:biphenyl 2,3-dioxygenase subunit beta